MMKHYPLSIFIIIAICYLSFFTPPKTEMDEITNFDKLVHLCMYGGLTVIIWFEYLRRHSRIHWHQLILVGICFPILMSGIVEILQATCTSDRSGDWLDFAANCTGVLFGCLFSWYVTRRIIQKNMNKPV
ncbi:MULTISPECIES: VanZ family protein [Bacteroidaceae]|nr:VanZ family protein [Bacteroides gallinaceum]